MKTFTELRAFCEGYCVAATDLPSTDDWVVWHEYDINFAGAEYSQHAKLDNQLRVDAYKAGWVDDIGDPVVSFTVSANF